MKSDKVYRWGTEQGKQNRTDEYQQEQKTSDKRKPTQDMPQDTGQTEENQTKIKSNTFLKYKSTE